MSKGGVWKNSEDEILKALVMKYGNNEYSRIASLLSRKSSKQLKARWSEWLDPSVKKTEWTRQEDEKLLHLAKLMPSQWRTIAPIVGRTPFQCLGRYEKLLDAACAKDNNNNCYEFRKLHPGEIDPNPESKPARPDSVDMDEDEIEMLSEARARLANTKGKKARRKIREKLLEEARRLASLQKKRELKAAAGGFNVLRKRKHNGIDYNVEIPFQMKPPLGFYHVTNETQIVEPLKFPTIIEQLEGEKRSYKEARLRRQDVAMNKIAQRQDAPSITPQPKNLNDQQAIGHKAKLNLPAPQISDHELEHIAKLSRLPSLSEELAQGNGATCAFLADYAPTPSQEATSLRTPQRTLANKHDAIMTEAENQAKLKMSQTPLLGGENPELHPSDFSGVTPTTTPSITPSLKVVDITPGIGVIPLRDGPFGMIFKGTPIRDDLQFNTNMDMSGKLELRRKADLRRNLRSGLTSLPQPKNDYQIIFQPIPEDSEEPEEKMEEDMSGTNAREKAEEEAKLQALHNKRSKVLQRELPRPPAASLQLLKNSLLRADEGKCSFVPPTLIELADVMVRKELLSLLEHDNLKYPIDGKVQNEDSKGIAQENSAYVPLIDQFEEDDLKEADHYLLKECMAMGHESETLDKFVEAHRTFLNDVIYFPTRRAYGLLSVSGNMEKVTALQDEFENVRRRMNDSAKKAQKFEQKIKILTNGYQQRGRSLWSQIEATFKLMDDAETELHCLQALRNQEQLAASHRVHTLWEEVQMQKGLEQAFQKHYGYVLSAQARIQEEYAARQCALKLAEAA